MKNSSSYITELTLTFLEGFALLSDVFIKSSGIKLTCVWVSSERCVESSRSINNNFSFPSHTHNDTCHVLRAKALYLLLAIMIKLFSEDYDTLNEFVKINYTSGAIAKSKIKKIVVGYDK